ncbi:hypothetical protein BJ878DRAFT_545910 [Calycina marina]|uniref:Uncharacterized protein n=1 Tax=Calycina marina TaxID=1763456 RepID=A0A9P7YVY8_9HELO|nr:hypothetical protein BJ878DRAFT_545910 [Calycina marina]
MSYNNTVSSRISNETSPSRLVAARRYDLDPPTPRYPPTRLGIRLAGQRRTKPENRLRSCYMRLLKMTALFRGGSDEEGRPLGPMSLFSMKQDMQDDWREFCRLCAAEFNERCSCKVCGEVPGTPDHPMSHRTSEALFNLNQSLRSVNIAYLTVHRLLQISRWWQQVEDFYMQDLDNSSCMVRPNVYDDDDDDDWEVEDCTIFYENRIKPCTALRIAFNLSDWTYISSRVRHRAYSSRLLQ